MFRDIFRSIETALKNMRREAPLPAAPQGREFNTVIAGIREGVITYDPDFTILSMNRAAEQFFGVTAVEVTGKRIDPGLIKDIRLSSIVQTLFPSLAPRMAQLSEAGVWPQETSINLENPARELSVTTHRLTDIQGRAVVFLKLIWDRTNEKALMNSKNEFVGVAAHQLRTPLTAIRWSLENLEKATEGSIPKIKQSVAEMRDLVERTLKTANDLLDVTKMDEGKFEFHPTNVDFTALMEKILQAVTPIAKRYGVALYFNPPAVPIPTTRLDESSIATAIMNLLDNAIRYNVSGGKVVISVEAQKTDPLSLKVTIEDTGVGIPREELGKLFGKLQRASNAAKIEPNGSGLGLYITKNIIKNHGGDIGIVSELNRGTTAWFTLPLQNKH
ncbi:MAG: HAMP domain-containing sensor histidine kinase [Candidatus Jorgensenbacteria bacterium]